MIRIVNWNIGFTKQPWLELVDMDADVALLQETCTPPPEVADRVSVNPHRHWLSEHYSLTSFRPARVVKLSDRVDVEWFEQVAPHRGRPGPRQLPVSAPGLIDAAIVTPKDGNQPIIAVSMYGGWQRPHPYAGPGWIYPDASAHRIISDLTALIPTYETDVAKHRIIAAGDLNMSFDYELDYYGSFAARAQTVMDHMAALGMHYVGPRHPNGRQANPKPEHLKPDSLEVVTYHTVARDIATAHIQLDHVFASHGLHEAGTTRAMNEIDEWGSSDHCRIIIDVE